MVTWTYADLAKHEQRRKPEAAGEPCPKLQEQQASDAGSAHHKSKAPKVDAASGGEFCIAITLGASDRRRRDGDGAESTILDCLVTARRRLLALPESMLLELVRSPEGTRGLLDKG